MYPIQAGQPGVNQFAGATRFGAAVRFGAEEPRKPGPDKDQAPKGTDGPSKETKETQGPKETPDAAEIGGVRKTVDQPEKPVSQFSHNAKMAKVMLFSSAIPLATCFLYTMGFWPGALIGAPIAYLSGLYGRKLRKDINAEEVHQALSAIDTFAEKLKKGPENLQPGDFSQLLNSATGNSADLFKSSKLGTMGLALFRNKFVLNILEKLGVLKLFRGLKSFGPIKALTERLGLLKVLDQGGVQAAEHAGADIAMKGLLKGLSINMRVANESNPVKAIGAGIWGLVSFVCMPFFLGIKLIQFLTGRHKKDEQGPNQA